MVAPAPRRLRRFFRPPTVLQWNHEKVFPTFYQTSKPITPKSRDREGQRFRAAEETTENKQREQKKVSQCEEKGEIRKIRRCFFLQNYCTKNQLQSSAKNASNNLVCCWGETLVCCAEGADPPFPTRVPSKSTVEFDIDPRKPRSPRKRVDGPLRGKAIDGSRGSVGIRDCRPSLFFSGKTSQNENRDQPFHRVFFCFHSRIVSYRIVSDPPWSSGTI